jgi:hypothetical protein
MVLFILSNRIASHLSFVLFVVCILANSFCSKQVFFKLASLSLVPIPCIQILLIYMKRNHTGVNCTNSKIAPHTM